MSPLLKEVRALIQGSLALQRDSVEQAFWLDRTKTMNDEQLSRLKEVLEEEASSKAKLGKESAERIAKIDADHLAELENFKRIGLPRFLKKWEAAQTEKENPDELLKQISDA